MGHCFYMKKLIELGIVEAVYENIDEKGWSWSYYLVVNKPDKLTHYMIGYCPGCGAKICRLCPPPEKCAVDMETHHPELETDMYDGGG